MRRHTVSLHRTRFSNVPALPTAHNTHMALAPLAHEKNTISLSVVNRRAAEYRIRRFHLNRILRDEEEEGEEETEEGGKNVFKRDVEIPDEEIQKYISKDGSINDEEFFKLLESQFESKDSLAYMLHNGLRKTEDEESEEIAEWKKSVAGERLQNEDRQRMLYPKKIKGLKTSPVITDYLPELRENFRAPVVPMEDMLTMISTPPAERDFVIVDLREKMQILASSPVPTSVNIPMSKIREGALLLEPHSFQYVFDVKKPKLSDDIVLVAVDPNVSELASFAFVMAGYPHVYNFRPALNALFVELKKISDQVTAESETEEGKKKTQDRQVAAAFYEYQQNKGEANTRKEMEFFAQSLLNNTDNVMDTLKAQLESLPDDHQLKGITISESDVAEAVAMAKKVLGTQ